MTDNINNTDSNDNIDKNIIKQQSDTADLWKHFFKNPKVGYNIYLKKLLDYPEYIIYDKESMDACKGKWSEVFQNDNDIYLEIGSGSGNFIQKLADINRDKNYICLELRFKRIYMSAKKLKNKDITSVKLLRRRSEEIPAFIGPNEISGIYINFPDPWEKKEKNRVLQESFFAMTDVIMRKHGKIFFKTDHDKYYEDILALVNNSTNYRVVYHTNDVYSSPIAETNIKTEFEELFINKLKKNINYIEIEKIV